MKNKLSDDYLKVVEWSEEDQCYVGTAPGLIMGGVHGKNQKKVFEDLCQLVEESIQLLKKEKRLLPPATAKSHYSGKISLRIPSVLHQAITLRALQKGESVNRFIQHQLEKVL
ncbi:MAG: toxin-antitoxin system HicB family antitoxin [Deltaproteobacteria bacterium]|nr:toxin-antitoxin system HicB family antitoxin [Deltaproteobacteria bacterium]